MDSSTVSVKFGCLYQSKSLTLVAGIGYWQSGNVWSAIANQDHWVGTNPNEANVVNNLNTVFGLYANYDQYGYNDDAMCVLDLHSSERISYELSLGGGLRRRYMATGLTKTPAFLHTLLQHGTMSPTSQFLDISHQLTIFIKFISVITQADANAGTQPNKNFPIEGICNGG